MILMRSLGHSLMLVSFTLAIVLALSHADKSAYVATVNTIFILIFI